MLRKITMLGKEYSMLQATEPASNNGVFMSTNNIIYLRGICNKSKTSIIIKTIVYTFIICKHCKSKVPFTRGKKSQIFLLH